MVLYDMLHYLSKPMNRTEDVSGWQATSLARGKSWVHFPGSRTRFYVTDAVQFCLFNFDTPVWWLPQFFFTIFFRVLWVPWRSCILTVLPSLADNMSHLFVLLKFCKSPLLLCQTRFFTPIKSFFFHSF